MSALATKLEAFLAEWQAQSYIFVALAVIALGLTCLFNPEAAEIVKKRWLWFLLGLFLVFGGITVGANLGNELKF